MSQLMIKVTDLDITYATLSRSRGRRGPRRVEHIPALRNINFEIYQGESVGFVGGNGAGKSTLLRTIAGICAPTRGEVLVRDQPWLLGVNASLLPRLTGAQNIEIGLLSLGIDPSEAKDLAPKVAEFSRLGSALNRPLKTYSSGMRARLQFSIATVKRPQILLLDEALAVGDLNFKRRSLRRINTLRGNASTILLVSHSTAEIGRTCTRTIWMDQGEIVLDGETETVLDAYGRSQEEDDEQDDEGAVPDGRLEDDPVTDDASAS